MVYVIYTGDRVLPSFFLVDYSSLWTSLYLDFVRKLQNLGLKSNKKCFHFVQNRAMDQGKMGRITRTLVLVTSVYGIFQTKLYMSPRITLLVRGKRNYACFYVYLHVLQCNYGYLFKIIHIEETKAKFREKIYAKLRVP